MGGVPFEGLSAGDGKPTDLLCCILGPVLFLWALKCLDVFPGQPHVAPLLLPLCLLIDTKRAPSFKSSVRVGFGEALRMGRRRPRANVLHVRSVQKPVLLVGLCLPRRAVRAASCRKPGFTFLNLPYKTSPARNTQERPSAARGQRFHVRCMRKPALFSSSISGPTITTLRTFSIDG